MDTFFIITAKFIIIIITNIITMIIITIITDIDVIITVIVITLYLLSSHVVINRLCRNSGLVSSLAVSNSFIPKDSDVSEHDRDIVVCEVGDEIEKFSISVVEETM